MENIHPVTKVQEHPCFWVQYHAEYANIYRTCQQGGVTAVKAGTLEGLVAEVKRVLGFNYAPIPLGPPKTSSFGGPNVREEHEDPPGLYPPCDM